MGSEEFDGAIARRAAGRAAAPAPEGVPLLEARAVTKRYGSVLANDRVSLAVREGEIQSVLGENGAGKSTLLSILAGMVRPDAGAVAVRGEEVDLRSPHDALARGIAAVYQHFTLVPTLTVAENLLLGAGSGFLLDARAAAQRLARLAEEVGLPVPAGAQVRHLAVGQRQRAEILKALARDPDVLLLDEPTSVLAPPEVEELFAALRRLRARGVAIVLVTHKLEEALAVSDRISVLRQGRKVGEIGPEALAATPPQAVERQVVEWMFGRPAEEPSAGPGVGRPGGPLLVALGLRALGDRGELAVRDISLELRAGEILGVAGVDGNGQKELAEAIAGQRRVAAGRIAVGGVDITNRGVAAALAAGVEYLTDDRLGEGVVPSASVAENLALKAVGRPPLSRRGRLDRRAMEERARRLIAEFDIRAPGPWAPVATLSGGNVQKLLLARALAAEPRVLVCNKPTIGLDLRTARAFLGALRARADQGMAVLLISSELDEVLAVSDRVAVMFSGRLSEPLPRGRASREAIGRLMLGLEP